MKRVILLVGFFISWSQLQAQFYIGSDLGAINYDISDEYISSFRYENFTISIINPSLFYQNENHIIVARFGKKVTRADLAQQEDYRAENFLEIDNYELDIEYFRKVINLSSRLEGFLGISQNGHFTYHNRIFRSPFLNEELDSHEMGGIVLSANMLLRLNKGSNSFHYKVGAGVLNIGSRPGTDGNEIELSRFPMNEYFRFHNSFVVNLNISNRLLIKPEYRLRYYTFRNAERFKMLKQSFFIGVFVRL